MLREKLLDNSLDKFKYKFFVGECDIIPNKALVSAVLPRRDGKGLHWDLCNIERGVYNSVDLKRAVEHGYKIVKIHEAVCWTKADNLFKDYIEKVFKMKQEAKKDTPQYTIAKLLMNSLYGKMLQTPVTEKNCIVTTLNEVQKIQDKNKMSLDLLVILKH
jgi:hypothetical protein